MPSRIDYCNAIYAGAPKAITDKLQRVLNAAARVVSDTKKFDRGLTRLLHDKLHWLDVPERVTFKLGLMTLNTSICIAPNYRRPQERSYSQVYSQAVVADIGLLCEGITLVSVTSHI